MYKEDSGQSYDKSVGFLQLYFHEFNISVEVVCEVSIHAMFEATNLLF